MFIFYFPRLSQKLKKVWYILNYVLQVSIESIFMLNLFNDVKVSSALSYTVFIFLCLQKTKTNFDIQLSTFVVDYTVTY